MKARMYWSYATRSLVRGGQRSLLAVFCVTVGVLAIVALQLVSNDVAAAFQSNLQQSNGGDVAVSTNTPFTSQQLAPFQRLQSSGAITSYTAVDSVNAQTSQGGKTLSYRLLAVDPTTFPLPGGVQFQTPSGGQLATQISGTSVVLTTRLAQVFGLHVGDTLHFAARDGRSGRVVVGGIIQSTGFFDGSMLLMARDAYATLPSANDQPLGYTVVYADVPGHTDAHAASVEQQLHKDLPLASTQTTKELHASVQQEVDITRYFLQIVALLALLIGGVGIMNTMQVGLRRRQTEIAMLKTAGYRRTDLYALFGLEAGLIGLAGGVLGAAAGVGASFLVKGLMESTFQTTLAASVDPLTVGSGVVVGLATALIFGLLPIVRASQVRPQAVLRETPEGVRLTSRVVSAGLLALLAVLFFGLALIILRNGIVALGAVGGAGILLGLLGLVFSVLLLAISHLPVLESFRLEYLLIVGATLLAGIGLASILPGFGIVLLALAVLPIVMVLLPRTAKANVKLALRNLGRQKARTVATLVALTVGVFAIGLVLALGQNIESYFTRTFSGQQVNVAILAGPADRAAVQRRLDATPHVRNEVVNTISRDAPVALNGTPLAQIVRAGAATQRYQPGEYTNSIDGVQGYDLAAGSTPNSQSFKLVRGAHDARTGRNLTARDAGTRNVLLPERASEAPTNFKLGDTVTIGSPTGTTTETVTVVGFYSSSLEFEPIQADTSVASTLAGGSPQYAYFAYLDPNTADTTLAQIQGSLPSVQTFSLTAILAQITAIMNNVITLLVTIASLALLASIIIIANAVALAMLERRRELGILKSVGYTSGTVLGEVLLENGVVGVIGGALAMLLVTALLPVLGSTVFQQSFGVSPLTVLEIVLATVLACMLVAAGVAWRATRVRPLDVLRYE